MQDHRFEGGLTIDEYRERHRKRLRANGLLNRGWAILGAAPDPAIPGDLLRSHNRIDINDSGLVAQKHGYGRAELTFRSGYKKWEDHHALDTSAMMMVQKRRSLLPRLILFNKPYRHVGKIWAMLTGDMQRIVEHISGVDLGEIGATHRASTAVSAACYGLFVGVPQIVIMGVSTVQHGYAYQSIRGKRRQMEEDEAVLRALAASGKVLTTEPGLMHSTGLAEWRYEPEAESAQ